MIILSNQITETTDLIMCYAFAYVCAVELLATGVLSHTDLKVFVWNWSCDQDIYLLIFSVATDTHRQ